MDQLNAALNENEDLNIRNKELSNALEEKNYALEKLKKKQQTNRR